MAQFIVGVFVGAIVTVIVMSLIVIAGDRKDREEREMEDKK